ncbi:hypothetical protein HBI25_186690 [Parastagonospora nodorum]|nr:hypothetical protein HBH53_180840 [Parastagonospora nodorum]KAH4051051.1 hypothetical protein HBH49_127100 [Parastagonospora nodorum]KAH4159762.1 hypothetical protein HBH43_183850 [Parastagonospora nodorum]KAH4187798.1 hypothetical protein HBH42_150190 [Parastagonospora nodorum]KAH5186788.1 hypothetical protein HBH76_114350 [Parastagonospora nodorum]
MANWDSSTNDLDDRRTGQEVFIRAPNPPQSAQRCDTSFHYAPRYLALRLKGSMLEKRNDGLLGLPLSGVYII